MIVKVAHTISMGHRLPSYDGICSSMHGHNVRVEAEIRVESEFLDFKRANGWLKAILEDLDHAMVLYEEDPIVPLFQGGSDSMKVMRFVLLSVEPTTEALAQLVMNELSPKWDVASVTVHETDKYSATCVSLSDEVFRVTK